jgi:hypothetical protein
MKLRGAGARLLSTAALALGIGFVLAAATIISRRFIETPARRARPPVLRQAAVFAPTLVGAGTAAGEIDAIAGPAWPAQAAVRLWAPPSVDAYAASQKVSPTAVALADHAPRPVPAELLRSLCPPAAGTVPTGGPVAPKPAAARPTSPAALPLAKPAPPEPRLELIDENIWHP